MPSPDILSQSYTVSICYRNNFILIGYDVSWIKFSYLCSKVVHQRRILKIQKGATKALTSHTDTIYFVENSSKKFKISQRKGWPWSTQPTPDSAHGITDSVYLKILVFFLYMLVQQILLGRGKIICV